MERGRDGSPNHFHHRHPHKDHQQRKRRANHALNDQKKIYTDWANHYLVKSGHQRLIKDLQQDLSDGVLLAQVIQVVANEKIADINGFPTTESQMIENIDACLGFLAAKGINTQGLRSEEISRGNLKCILGLFFSLSKYKQQQQHQKALKQAGSHSSPGQSHPQAQAQASPSRGTKHTSLKPSDTLNNPSQVSGGARQSLIQRKASRLPAPTMRVQPPSHSPSPSPSSSSKRRSQSFSHYDQPRAWSHTSACTHTERSISPSIMMQQTLSPAPLNPTSSPFSSYSLPQRTSSSSSLPTSSISNSTLTQSVLDSSSYKAWKSRSLSTKHSAASSSLLSVKIDTFPSMSPSQHTLSLSLPQLHDQSPLQPLSIQKPLKQLQNQPPTPKNLPPQPLSLCLPQTQNQPHNQLATKPSKQPQAKAKVLEVPPKVIAQKSMLEKLKLFNSKSSSKGSSGVVASGSLTDTRSGQDTQKKGKGEKKGEKKGAEKGEKRGEKKQERRGEKGERRKRRESESRSLASLLDDASVTPHTPSSLSTCTPIPSPPAPPTSPPTPSPTLPSPKLALRNLGRALNPRKGSMKQGERDNTSPKEKAVSGGKDKDKTGSKEDRPGAKDRLKNGTKDKEKTREKNGRKEKERVRSGSGWGTKRASQSDPQSAGTMATRQEGVGSEAEPAKRSTNQVSGLGLKGSKTNCIRKDHLNPTLSNSSTVLSSTLAPNPISTSSLTLNPSLAQSSTPKPGKSSTPPPRGREGERRDSNSLSVHQVQTDQQVGRQASREMARQTDGRSSSSVLVVSEGGCLHQADSSVSPPVARGGSTQTNVPVSTTTTVQLPRVQPYSHHNTATVAPFIYRSQPDVMEAVLMEAGSADGRIRKSTFSHSAHSSLEDLTDENLVEARRLRTVRNMAELRQNLQETMTCLRGTQITHCTEVLKGKKALIDTTLPRPVAVSPSSSGPAPDDTFAMETTNSGRSPCLSPGPRPCSTLPWRLTSMSRPPRLQAGDAPSLGNSCGSSGMVSVAVSPESGRYLRRQQPTGQETDKMEDVEVITMETGGYSSDGDVLGKTMRMDGLNEGYRTGRAVGVISRRMASLSQLDVMTSSMTSQAVGHTFQLSASGRIDYDSWDDSSSVSSGTSDAFDPDDITCSLVKSFVKTPPVICKDLPLKLQTDSEKHYSSPCWPGGDMETQRSDLTDQSQHSSSGRKTPSIGHTGSWRRGMSGQVGASLSRSKTPPTVSMTTKSSSPLKLQGTGKTDDAKASERGCLSPGARTSGSAGLLLRSPSSEAGRGGGEENRKAGTGSGSGSSSARTNTSRFGFRKHSTGVGGGLTTIVTSSGATITSGSATVGKLPRSTLTSTSPGPNLNLTVDSSRTPGRQRSVDDGYLCVNSRRSLLQYRSLPRPSRNHGNRSNDTGITGLRTTGTVIDILGSRNTSGFNGTKRGTRSKSGNQTDGEKGGRGEERGEGLEESVCGEKGVSVAGVDIVGGSGESMLPQGSRRTGGKFPDMASPTLRRLFNGSRSGKQPPLTMADNMKNSTIISNPHTATGHQGGDMDSPSTPPGGSSPLYGRGEEGGGEGGRRGGLGKELGLSPLTSNHGSAFTRCPALSTTNSSFSSPNPALSNQNPTHHSPNSALFVPSHNLSWSSGKPTPGYCGQLPGFPHPNTGQPSSSPSLPTPSPGQASPGCLPSSLGSLATSTESMDVSLGSCGERGGVGGGGVTGQNGVSREDTAQLSSCMRTNGVKMGYADSPLSSPSASPQLSRSTFPRRRDRYAHLSPLRGEEHRDWLRSHSGGGVQESGASSPFSPSSSLSSPSGARFAISSQLGSPTNQMSLSTVRFAGVANGLSNQEAGYCDTYGSSNMSLDEKSRTISTSGSFRDGLEEVNGSSLSLVSSTSSVYSTPEEKSQSEIRKLRRELDASQEKVSALTTQLSANAHLVAAFEQSLSNMTVRLQSLTTMSEQKDSELNELRRAIELLKKQNSEAQAAINTVINTAETGTPHTPVSEQSSPVSAHSERSETHMVRQPSTDSVTSLTSITSHTSLSSLGSGNDVHSNQSMDKKKKRNWLRSSFKQAFGKRRSHKSASSHSDMDDSSLPSSPKLPSNHQIQRNHQNTPAGPKTSYRPNHPVSKTTSYPQKTSPTSLGLGSSHSNSLPYLPPAGLDWGYSSVFRTGSLARISECVSVGEAEMVMQLRTELRDKDMKLTDIRLEALSSAHQLDTLREAMTRMQGEMETLRQENETLRLETHNYNQNNHNHRNQHQDHSRHNHSQYQNQTQQQTHSRQQPQVQMQLQLNGSAGGGGSSQPPVSSLSLGQTVGQHSLSDSTSLDMLLLDSAESSGRKEGRHVKVVVSLDHHDNKTKQESRQSHFLIGCIRVSGRTRWDILDGVVRRLFKEYLLHVDPVGQLGLSSDSVLGYSIADIHRRPGIHTPELLPCGYLVGDSDTISVSLKDSSLHSADSLAFETLVPLPIMQQYISQLQEHGRIFLSGASRTGKSVLALRLAEHMVQREGLEVTPGVIDSFSVDGDNSQELHEFLCRLSDQYQCSSNSISGEVETRTTPLVVILENLHQLPSAPAELLNDLFNSTQHRCPYIIGTMTHFSSSPSLLLHQNVSGVLWSNQEEPVKSFLGHFLKRKLLEAELSSRCRNPELTKVVDWLPAVWRHLNHFLETHSSADATIGPCLFLSCPMAVEASRLWFMELWNYSVIPYCLQAARQGLQLYGRRAEWEDPATWVIDSWPWSSSPSHQDLLHARPEDVGFHGYPDIQTVQTDTNAEELVNMLQRLKEATPSYHSNGHHDNTAPEPSLESVL